MGAAGDLPGPEALLELAADLVALPRALTGDGVRQTLRLARDWLPGLAVHEVPSGTPVLDWTVPPEWTLRRATLTGPDGDVLADSDAHPLAVVGHSAPVDAELSLEEVQDHLHSLPDQPDVLPWRTSYYTRTWGFCLPDRVRRHLRPGRYRAVVDASLEDGHLTYGEWVLPGAEPAEVLLSTHLCHPAMANDNASGLAVALAVGAALAGRPRRLTVRVLLVPGTIGALAWLARADVSDVVGGLVLAGLGDPGERLTYKRSRRGRAPMDRAAELALRDAGVPHDLLDYVPWGYDERQYNSPGFDLGVGLLNRTPFGTYPEYHTSADDLSFLRADHLHASARLVLAAVEALDADRRYVNRRPHGEPQLGRRGLWSPVGGTRAHQEQLALLWVLSESDGDTGVLAIAERSGLPVPAVAAAAARLAGTDLLDEVTR